MRSSAFRFIGRGATSLTTLVMRMVPPAVLLGAGVWHLDVRLLLGRRIVSTVRIRGIIFVYVAMNLPFVIWILQSFIVQVPVQLGGSRAQKSTAPGRFATFFLVVLPLIRPGLAAAAIFTFRIAWNEFLLANSRSPAATRAPCR